MFNFSLPEFFMYELIANDEITAFVNKKKITDPIKAKNDIAKIIKRIIGKYIARAGLLPYMKKLRVEQQYISKEGERLLQKLHENPESGEKISNEFSFFKKLQRDSMSNSFLGELDACFIKLTEQIYKTPNEKILLFFSQGVCYSQIHSALVQIYGHMQKKLSVNSPVSCNFDEYLLNNGRNFDPGRPDLFNYLDSLEIFLTTLLLPVKGDTHLKSTVIELMSEIDKIRHKLQDDEQEVLKAESEKMRAMQYYILMHVHLFDIEKIKVESRKLVNDHVEKIEHRTLDKNWHFLNSTGYFDNYTQLLRALNDKIDYINRILEKSSIFGSVISEIGVLHAKKNTESKNNYIYRIISQNELDKIKIDKCFTQDKRFSTAENAKWYYFNNGKPGIANAYLCKIVCREGTLDLIQRLTKDVKISAAALLVKENEPDCIGVHEEVLAHFNLLILRVEATDKAGKKFFIDFDNGAPVVENLLPGSKAADVLTYFMM
ncbi:MAG: hypothetical protein NTZ67_05010 [Gammaproteobacteria bacterium]|nr:hypothetical protein [Gammaproteobacteria bacterium]